MENYKFTTTHEWIKLKEDNIYLIGISDYAQHALTDIVYVELPEEGTELDAGNDLCVLESTKSAATVYSPLSGEIIQTNKSLVDNPHFINESPYEDGWICELKIKDVTELNNLMTYEEYIISIEENH